MSKENSYLAKMLKISPLASLSVAAERCHSFEDDVIEMNCLIAQQIEEAQKVLIPGHLLPLLRSMNYVSISLTNQKEYQFIWGREILGFGIPPRTFTHFEGRVVRDGVSRNDTKAFERALYENFNIYKRMIEDRLRVYIRQLKSLKKPTELTRSELLSFHSHLFEERERRRSSLRPKSKEVLGGFLRKMVELDSQISYLKRLIASSKGP